MTAKTLTFKKIQPKKAVYNGSLHFVKGAKGFQKNDVTFAFSASYVREIHQIDAHVYQIAA